MKSTIDREKIFNGQVDEWVIATIRAGARDLDALIRELPGVYPTEVAESLNRLAVRRIIARSTVGAMVSPNPTCLHFHGYKDAFNLPVPHPLDYDWRFTPDAVDQILDLCQQYGNDLVCLGTPTVFIPATKMMGVGNVVLLDHNVAVLRHLHAMVPGAQILCKDLLVDSIPMIQFDSVVADPPWYSEYMLAFIWVASRICRLGGHLLISLPPRGTRPTVATELALVFSYAKRLGFSIRQMEEDYLPYQTPPFELNALQAVGCRLSGRPWRRGTLCVLQRLEDTNVERPRSSYATAEWSEATLYGTRFRFRHGRRTSFDDPSLIPLVPGDILSTVSRRNRLRGCVDVWSSGNRVFRCCAPTILRIIVEALAAGKNPVDAVAKSITMRPSGQSEQLIQNAAMQIERLAAKENSECRFIGTG